MELCVFVVAMALDIANKIYDSDHASKAAGNLLFSYSLS